MHASASSKPGLNREVWASLLRVRTRPEWSEDNLRELMRRVDSLEKTLMLGGIGGRRRRGQQRMRWLDGIADSMDVSLNSGSWWWTGRPGMLQFMGSQRVGHDWATELNWMCKHTTLTDVWRLIYSEQLFQQEQNFDYDPRRKFYSFSSELNWTEQLANSVCLSVTVFCKGAPATNGKS